MTFWTKYQSKWVYIILTLRRIATFMGVCFLTFSWFFRSFFEKIKIFLSKPLYWSSNIMAKIDNFDFLEEILKNQLKLRLHTHHNVAILFNLSIIKSHLGWYFVQNIIFKIFDFVPIIQVLIYHQNLKETGGRAIYWVNLFFSLTLPFVS